MDRLATRILSIEQPTDDQREAINRMLREFNQYSNPVFWEARAKPQNAVVAVQLFGFDATGEIVGGLFGERQFKWLKVHVMAVRPDLRGRGVGAALLAKAERDAARAGCKYAYIDTMDYQAPGFYEKVGYRKVGEIADWDSHGHSKKYFVKPLA
ncbi:MAG: GNAT family N-acetyltransferase [Planctomycetes bacterium]|nr:GNAT family N-acetyltransferase [Planctomycetota bacterium]